MNNVNIYPDLLKPNKQGLAPIVFRIDYKRKHIAIDPTGHRIHLSMWDHNLKRAKGPSANLLNSIIEKTLTRHKDFILKREAFGLPVTKEIIKRYLKTGAFDDFYTYAETLIREKKLKDGKPYDDETKRRYSDEIGRMKQFAPDLTFNQIDFSFLTDYRLWMQNSYLKKDKTPLHQNSIWKAVGFIRMVYNEAIRNEIILPEGNPFKKFKVGSYEQDTSKIKYLELHEIEKLEEVLTTREIPQVTQRVGWRFLAMCVSGMRISDALLLEDYFFNDIGNLEFKPYKTRRHDNTATIPITTDRQRRYFEKTLSYSFKEKNPKTFRSTFNDNLRILAAMAGISINLTSHTGRHTMGSFLVDAGIETRPAMAMLGVKSKKVIETYLHLKQSKLKSEADKFKGVM